MTPRRGPSRVTRARALLELGSAIDLAEASAGGGDHVVSVRLGAALALRMALEERTRTDAWASAWREAAHRHRTAGVLVRRELEADLDRHESAPLALACSLAVVALGLLLQMAGVMP